MNHKTSGSMSCGQTRPKETCLPIMHCSKLSENQTQHKDCQHRGGGVIMWAGFKATGPEHLQSSSPPWTPLWTETNRSLDQTRSDRTERWSQTQQRTRAAESEKHGAAATIQWESRGSAGLKGWGGTFRELRGNICKHQWTQGTS